MYHQLVHLLDLCTFSYQLHSQTLIWPMDPYYDQLSGDSEGLRNSFMAKVHQVATPAKYAKFRGPGSINGWTSNPGLDPVISDYSQINPWRPSVTRPNREVEGWILYDTPREITDRIREVRMASYNKAQPPPNGVVPTPTQILARPAGLPGAPGTDWLYCFEGGTGGIPEKNTAAAWSMMGLVLAREDDTIPLPPPVPAPPYDLYIVFRGSRSGDPRLGTALRDGTGNPDWVTDMNFGFGPGTGKQIPAISAIGNVSPGFAASVQTMLPTIMKCLEHIQANKPKAPRTIYVTGHSLGAALAVHFTSAILLGTRYGYKVIPTRMSAALQQWPWSATQLVPFSLPVVGGKKFHGAFNIALASRRVYLTGDPVVQTIRRYQVGHPYEIDPESVMNLSKRGIVIDPLRHEPYLIREYLIKDLTQRGLLSPPVPGPPWKTFKDFKEVLLEPRTGNDPVSQILGTNFNDRLLLYLEVLGAIVSDSEKQSRVEELHQAIEYINTDPNYIQWHFVSVNRKTVTGPLLIQKNMVQVYKDSKNIIGSPFDKFLGLCLFLSVASKGTFTQASNRVFKPNGIEPFMDLPLK
jgi:hypothetical protein